MHHLPEPFHRLRLSCRHHLATRPHVRSASSGHVFQRRLHRGLYCLGDGELRKRRGLFRTSCVGSLLALAAPRELMRRIGARTVKASLLTFLALIALAPILCTHSPHVGRLYLGADDSPFSSARGSRRLHVQHLPDPAQAVRIPSPPPLSLFFPLLCWH